MESVDDGVAGGEAWGGELIGHYGGLGGFCVGYNCCGLAKLYILYFIPSKPNTAKCS